MCWKRVKPYLYYLCEKINPRQWSIVKQLSFLYTTSTIVIMLVIFCLLYMTLQNSLYKVNLQLSGLIGVHELALMIDREKMILKDYTRMFISITIFGALFATLLGIMLARKSMMPLKNIMRTVGHINTKKLHGRLVPHNWPKEFTALAENFNNMLDRLEKSFEQLTRFSADLAHELRTPINNLKGEAEICLTKKRSLEEYQLVLESSLEEYERLSRMIEGLLFLARAEDPSMQIDCSEIKLRNMVDSIFEYYLPIAEENKVELSCEGEATVWANELLLQRALHNIVSNAIRYTPKNGKISANIKTLPSGEASIELTDTGFGIAKKQLPYIFNRFYRTDNARAQTSGGSGLGLAILKSIMDLHHGRIKVSSELGKGTIVTLIFPPKN